MQKTLSQMVRANQIEMFETHEMAKSRCIKNRLFWTFQFVALVAAFALAVAVA